MSAPSEPPLTPEPALLLTRRGPPTPTRQVRGAAVLTRGLPQPPPRQTRHARAAQGGGVGRAVCRVAQRTLAWRR
eukprot:7887058-Alexandrium_andersonii.AAC.1